MLWWQIALIIFMSIVVGILAGEIIGYVVVRARKKPLPKKHRTRATVQQQIKSDTAPELLNEIKSDHIIASEPPKKYEAAAAVQERIKYITAPELLDEIENNHRIASEPWTGELLPFKTDEWDSGKHNISDLKTGLQKDLIQAYIDMSLANNIVWLATDLNRRNRGLDQYYVRLCQEVAAKLDRILVLLKQPST